MTEEEALKILDSSPYKDSNAPSAINPAFTCRQLIDLIKSGMTDGPKKLSDLLEKRVWQVAKNQKRPRY